MAIVFTCAKCETRSAKAFSRRSYEQGLVLITCPGCKAMHLIADHLGWFEDSGFKIDEYLAARGQTVKRAQLDELGGGQQQQVDGQEQQQQLTAEDLAGWSKVQQLMATMTAAAQSGQEQDAGASGCCSSDSGGSAGGSGGSGDPAAEAEDGVVQVSPDDVDAWARVQQLKQA